MTIRSSPTGGFLLLAAVKSFDANIAVIGNFVLNEKKPVQGMSVTNLHENSGTHHFLSPVLSFYTNSKQDLL